MWLRQKSESMCVDMIYSYSFRFLTTRIDNRSPRIKKIIPPNTTQVSQELYLVALDKETNTIRG